MTTRFISLGSAPFAAALILAPLAASAQEAEPPKQLEFTISKGTNPDGKGNYGGKVKFERDNTKVAFKVTWNLSNGDTATGWGVPFPKTPYIAVAYGANAAGVALYHLNGETFDAAWALAKEDAPIGSYSLKRSKTKYQYSFADGSEGAVTIAPSEKIQELATLKMKLPGVSTEGYAVGFDEFLGGCTATGGDDFGVAVYKFTSPTSASGKWYLNGAPGFGLEELKLTSVDGKEVPEVEGETPVAADAADAGAEVKSIAESLKGSKAAIMKLKPGKEQIAMIAATEEDAKVLAEYTESLFASLPESGLQAKEGQTQILVTSREDLPGGYAQQAAHLKKDITIYGFKYVAPGEKIGMAFDGLVKLDGKWVMIPKMFRAFGK